MRLFPDFVNKLLTRLIFFSTDKFENRKHESDTIPTFYGIVFHSKMGRNSPPFGKRISSAFGFPLMCKSFIDYPEKKNK